MPDKDHRTSALNAIRIGLFFLLCHGQSSTAQIYFPQAGMPEAHYWQDYPGVLVVKPQATVRSIFRKHPQHVSLEQLMNLNSPNRLSDFNPKTDQQWAREDAQRETVSDRIGSSNWHYGWGVGFEGIRVRVSFDF